MPVEYAGSIAAKKACGITHIHSDPFNHLSLAHCAHFSPPHLLLNDEMPASPALLEVYSMHSPHHRSHDMTATYALDSTVHAVSLPPIRFPTNKPPLTNQND